MKRFQTKLRKICEKIKLEESFLLGKIMLEIILTKTKKVVSTGSDNSRMKISTFSIKNVKN
jgi:hypothetical protein